MSRINWGKVREFAAQVAVDVAIAAIGAFLADRQKSAAPAQPAPTPQPPPRTPDVRIPGRADAEITATGHANIDARFRPAPPQAPAPRAVPITERAPAPLPGSALHGHEPPDADPTEPDAHEPIGPRDMQ